MNRSGSSVEGSRYDIQVTGLAYQAPSALGLVASAYFSFSEGNILENSKVIFDIKYFSQTIEEENAGQLCGLHALSPPSI